MSAGTNREDPPWQEQEFETTEEEDNEEEEDNDEEEDEEIEELEGGVRGLLAPEAGNKEKEPQTK